MIGERAKEAPMRDAPVDRIAASEKFACRRGHIRGRHRDADTRRENERKLGSKCSLQLSDRWIGNGKTERGTVAHATPAARSPANLSSPQKVNRFPKTKSSHRANCQIPART